MRHIEVIDTIDLRTVALILRNEAERLGRHIHEWHALHGDCQYTRIRELEAIRLDDAANFINSLIDEE